MKSRLRATFCKFLNRYFKPAVLHPYFQFPKSDQVANNISFKLFNHPPSAYLDSPQSEPEAPCAALDPQHRPLQRLADHLINRRVLTPLRQRRIQFLLTAHASQIVAPFPATTSATSFRQAVIQLADFVVPSLDIRI